jgi:urease accessory protein
MQHASRIRLRGDWPAAEEADRIVLAFDQRWRRRLKLTTSGGEAFLLDLSQASVLRDGDALVLDDGRLVAVAAAAEDLLEVRGTAQIALPRIAWHLGNRHTPTAIEHDRILVRRDHVLADMLRRLGAEVREVSAPFDPEGGAYATGHSAQPPHGRHHSHGHSHGHGDGHDQ